MKWIGQHIWDFISRFRNDVYLEDISTGQIASGGNLGLDSNNKIVKNTVTSGGTSNVTSLDHLTDVTITGTPPDKSILHYDSNTTKYINSATLDTTVLPNIPDTKLPTIPIDKIPDIPLTSTTPVSYTHLTLPTSDLV